MIPSELQLLTCLLASTTAVELCDGAELRTAKEELETRDMRASQTTATFFKELSFRAAKARLAWRLGATSKAWRDAHGWACAHMRRRMRRRGGGIAPR